MIQLGFHSAGAYADSGREHTGPGNLSAVSGEELRWYYFLGRLSISDSGREVGPPWEWVPLFDALHCVRNVMDFAAGKRAVGVIDFTENDEEINFQRDGGTLRLVPSYLNQTLNCPVGEFLLAGKEFIDRELLNVVRSYPGLVCNPDVIRFALKSDVKITDR